MSREPRPAAGSALPELFGPQWASAWCAAIGASAVYRQTAATWEGSLVVQMTADAAEGVASERAVWLDLWHGSCRGARVATGEELASAAFVICGPPAVWRGLLQGKGDPLLAIVTGKLKLARGKLVELMPYARAAQELVITARGLPVRLPEGWDEA